VCLIINYYDKNIKCQFFCNHANQRAFYESNFNLIEPYSTLIVLCSTKKLKLEHLVIQFKFHNIQINDQAQFAMINMPIQWHHIGICNKNCSLFDMFKMVVGSLFFILTPSPFKAIEEDIFSMFQSILVLMFCHMKFKWQHGKPYVVIYVT
jgi:hypothetical protein